MTPNARTPASACWTALLAAVVSAICWLAPTDARAQAWIEDPGDGYAELTFRRISGGGFYTSDGSIRQLPTRYTQSTVNLYGQVGVVDRWLQLAVDGEIFRHNKLEDQGATRGLGDIGLQAWTGILEKPFRLSAGLRLGLPTGDPDPEAGVDDPQAQIIAASLPTGDGEVDLTASVAWGVSVYTDKWPLRHYFTGSLGYQIRTKGFQDAFHWRAEFGTRIPVVVLDRIWFIARLTGVEPVGSTDSSSFSGLGSGVTYTSPGFAVAVDLYRGLGIKAGWESAFRAQNVIAGAPWHVGIYWDWEWPGGEEEKGGASDDTSDDA